MSVGSMGIPVSGYECTVREARVDASIGQNAEPLRRQRVARWATAAGLAGAAGLTVILLATVQGPAGSAADPRGSVSTSTPFGGAGVGAPGGVAPAGATPPAVEPPGAGSGTTVSAPVPPPLATPPSR